MRRSTRSRRRSLRASIEDLEPRQLLNASAYGGLGPEAVLKASDLGPWGRLKLVEKLETGGDHRVDALFDKLILKFDHWAHQHPNLARESGIKNGAIGSTITKSQVLRIRQVCRLHQDRARLEGDSQALIPRHS
jgi:hypothetical protein